MLKTVTKLDCDLARAGHKEKEQADCTEYQPKTNFSLGESGRNDQQRRAQRGDVCKGGLKQIRALVQSNKIEKPKDLWARENNERD
jgi:hypothetical protein